MISKDVFCILYHGMPIEGFSSASGHPIFTSNDKFIPNYSFSSYESARDSLTYMIQSLLDQNHDSTDMSLVSIGNIRMECREFTHISAYDEALMNIMKSQYNNPATIDRYVGKIIHLCVRKGFKKTLPQMHQQLLNDPQFVELLDKHVPFFVRQNIERFMDVGISACNEEEIAAIILTTDDELLKAIRIDSLNNVSN